MRKLAIITGTRAEYGLLSELISLCEHDSDINLQLIVTGMHLSPQYGETIKEIKADGHKITKKIELLLASNSAVGVAKATGLGLISFSEVFAELEPDLVIVLGDRFEILSAVTAALYAKIPIAHIHGGETTEGAFDEGIRHAISKMSHWHFVAAEEYRNRVIQLGEHPDRVYNVGGMGVDVIKKKEAELLSLEELSKSINFAITKPFFVITYHPVTLGNCSEEYLIKEFLKTLDQFKNSYQYLITLPNADNGSSIITEKIKDYASNNKAAVYLIDSLGAKRYWSALNHCALVLGNSSSGITEVPTFKKATVNIGERQKGRIMAGSIVSCEADSKSISKAIRLALSKRFQSYLPKTKNLYGEGGASHAIYDIVTQKALPNIQKKFHDLFRE